MEKLCDSKLPFKIKTKPLTEDMKTKLAEANAISNEAIKRNTNIYEENRNKANNCIIQNQSNKEYVLQRKLGN